MHLSLLTAEKIPSEGDMTDGFKYLSIVSPELEYGVIQPPPVKVACQVSDTFFFKGSDLSSILDFGCND